jgi:prophage regulatory protein
LKKIQLFSLAIGDVEPYFPPIDECNRADTMNIPAEQHSPFPFRDRILRQAEVEAKVGFRKTKMWELIADRAFPEPIALGPRAVGWRESEVDRWIAELPRATRFAKYLQGQLRPFFTRGPQIWNSFRKRVEQTGITADHRSKITRLPVRGFYSQSFVVVRD